MKACVKIILKERGEEGTSLKDLKKAAVRAFMESESESKENGKEEFKKVYDKMMEKGKIIMEGDTVKLNKKDKVVGPNVEDDSVKEKENNNKNDKDGEELNEQKKEKKEKKVEKKAKESSGEEVKAAKRPKIEIIEAAIKPKIEIEKVGKLEVELNLLAPKAIKAVNTKDKNGKEKIILLHPKNGKELKKRSPAALAKRKARYSLVKSLDSRNSAAQRSYGFAAEPPLPKSKKIKESAPVN